MIWVLASVDAALALAVGYLYWERWKLVKLLQQFNKDMADVTRRGRE